MFSFAPVLQVGKKSCFSTLPWHFVAFPLRSALSRLMKSTPGTSNMWDLDMAPMSRSPLSLRRGTSKVGRSISTRNDKTHQDLQISFNHPFDHPTLGVSDVFFPTCFPFHPPLNNPIFVVQHWTSPLSTRSTWSPTMLGCQRWKRWKRNPAAPSWGCWSTAPGNSADFPSHHHIYGWYKPSKMVLFMTLFLPH